MLFSQSIFIILKGFHAVLALIFSILIFAFNLSTYHIIFEFDSALPDVKRWYLIRDYLRRRGEIQSEFSFFNPESQYETHDGIQELADNKASTGASFFRRILDYFSSIQNFSIWYPRILNLDNEKALDSKLLKLPEASDFSSEECAKKINADYMKWVFSNPQKYCPQIPPPKADSISMDQVTVFTPRIDVADFGKYKLSFFPLTFMFRSAIQKNLREIVTFAHNVCEDLLEINCWLDSGTLLGAIRDKDIFYWDHDADMALSSRDFVRLQSRILDGSVRRFAKDVLNTPHMDIILQDKGRPHSTPAIGATFLPARVVDLRSGAYLDFRSMFEKVEVQGARDVDLLDANEGAAKVEKNSGTTNKVEKKSRITDDFDSSKFTFIVDGNSTIAKEDLLLKANKQVRNMVTAYGMYKRFQWEEDYKKNNPNHASEKVVIDGEKVSKMSYEFDISHKNITKTIAAEKVNQQLTKVTSATDVYTMNFVRHMWPYCSSCVRFSWEDQNRAYILVSAFVSGQRSALSMSAADLHKMRRM